MDSLTDVVNFEEIMDQAVLVVSILFPIFVIPLGMQLGVKLLNVIRDAISSAF